METKRCMRIWITAVAMMVMCVLIAAPVSVAYEASLKGYWKMDNNWNDSTTNVNTGAGYNGPFFVAGGKFGLTGYFDGSNDYVEVPYLTGQVVGSGQLTFSLWVASANFNQPWKKMAGSTYWTGSTTDGVFELSINGNSQPYFYIRNNAGSEVSPTGATLNNGAWNHIVGVYDGSSVKIYQNGVLTGSSGSAGTALKNLNWKLNFGSQLSGANSGATNFFNGYLDDAAIWNRPLAADEIRFLGTGSGHSVQTLEDTYASAGTSSGNWGTAGSWRAGIVPVSGKEVHLDSASTVTVDSVQASSSLYIGDVSGESGTVTQSGGTNTVGSLHMATNSGSSGTYNLNGGTLAVGGVSLGAGTSDFNLGGGTLQLNGTMSASSLKTLDATSGTIKGNATFTNVNFSVGSGVTLAPGNSPGTATINGGTMTWAGGGSLQFQISNATGIAGTDWDLVRLINGGSLNFTATSGNKFNINVEGLSSVGPDVSGNPANFNNSQGYRWNFIDTSGGGSVRGLDFGSIAFSATGGDLAANRLYLENTGSGVTLGYYKQAIDHNEQTVIFQVGLDKYERLSTGIENLADEFNINYDTTAMESLAALLYAGEQNQNPSPVTLANGEVWRYYDSAPGEGDHLWGDVWTVNNITYMKLGSDIGTGDLNMVPEPSSMAVSGLVFGLLGLIKRKRKKD